MADLKSCHRAGASGEKKQTKKLEGTEEPSACT